MGKVGWLWVVAVSGAAGFLAWQNHGLSERIGALSVEIERAGQAPRLPPPSLASCYLSPVFARQLAAELRGALASPPAAQPSPETPAAEAPTAADTDGAENANRVLDEVIARGRMTPDDLTALRRELATATTSERDQVNARIAAAINRDELVADDPRAVFP